MSASQQAIWARTPSRPTRAHAPVPALALALLCLLGMVLIWVFAALVPAVHLRDAIALRDFTRLSRPGLDTLGNGLLDLLAPLPAAIWTAALIAIALHRRRARLALAVALVMVLAPLSAEILKPLLAHSHAQVQGGGYVDAASWPSGHATAAIALALSAVLVAPARRRPAVLALGLLFAAAIGLSLLVLAWHMPSDVLGGYLLGTLWVSLAVGALRASDRRWPPRSGRRMQHAVRTSI